MFDINFYYVVLYIMTLPQFPNLHADHLSFGGAENFESIFSPFIPIQLPYKFVS